MNHANMYAVGLALCTFADIASEEMSRDLANEIEKLLGSSNTYIRKKVRQRGEPSHRAIHDLTFSGILVCIKGYQEGAGPFRPLHSQSKEPPR